MIRGIHPVMEFKGKKSFYQMGLASFFFGAIIALIGSRAAENTWLQATYASGFYWAITFGIVGAGLILAGLVLFTIGLLRVK